RHSRSIASVAAANSWRYTRRQRLDVGLGLPFDPGETAPCTNIIAGAVNGQAFTAFEYAHELQVFMIDLVRDLPFLEVRSRMLHTVKVAIPAFVWDDFAPDAAARPPRA